MSDELVKRHVEQLRMTGGDLADLCQPLADAIEALTSERDRLREALAMIDAVDPEHHIDGCAQTVVRGLVLRMGEISREALKVESHE